MDLTKQTIRQRSRPETETSKSLKGDLTRELNGSIRALDGNERTFELSFSSEEPYDRGWCIEILDHAEGAVDLSRLNDIGVVLYNHDRDKVVGRINRAWIENDRGMAEITFDNDEVSDVIYQKVLSGTLKGVSVGYQINSIEEVAAGKTSTDGRFTGPCDIARSWEPLEISIVSIPADPTVGVGRELEFIDGNDTEKQASSMNARQLRINLNKLL
ncbi:MAG: HK97 family phage prohead protease [Coprobacillus sp.]|nr:HK97 family phage prohead protease [Coprobacillus sp.]